MITDIEDFFTKGCGRCDRFATPDCSTRRWIEGLTKLREIFCDSGLIETVKWGHPCYMHAGRNIAIIGGFRGDFRLSFLNAALMTDPRGFLEKGGPNTRHPEMIRFRENSEVASKAPVIRSYLKEAMGYAEAGIKAPKSAEEDEAPEELTEALDADPELAEAFERLTPGRRRSYVINLRSAKASATRIARITKFRSKILAGMGAKER
jgi:uncharacterized protein YdeI (YjbR/CyaY-like superfamily)